MISRKELIENLENLKRYFETEMNMAKSEKLGHKENYMKKKMKMVDDVIKAVNDNLYVWKE